MFDSHFSSRWSIYTVLAGWCSCVCIVFHVYFRATVHFRVIRLLLLPALGLSVQCILKQDGRSECSDGRWRFVRTVGTGQRGPLGSFLRLSVDDFSVGTGELGQWHKTTNTASARSTVAPTSEAESLLLEPEPEPEPEPSVGSDLRQEALLELPTYHVTRHPEHWCAPYHTA